MKDIARELGVSVATVSRALKDSPRISAAQRERIQAFAQSHHFTPNYVAETLRHSRVRPQKIIGVIIPQFAHFYFSSILSGIEQEASARGYSIMVAQSDEQYDREVRICKSFYEHKVCGSELYALFVDCDIFAGQNGIRIFRGQPWTSLHHFRDQCLIMAG